MDLCPWFHGGHGQPFRPSFSYVPGEPLTEYIDFPPPDPGAPLDVHGNQVELLKQSRAGEVEAARRLGNLESGAILARSPDGSLRMVSWRTWPAVAPIVLLRPRRSADGVHRLSAARSRRAAGRPRQPGRAAEAEPLLPLFRHDLHYLPRRAHCAAQSGGLLAEMSELPQARLRDLRPGGPSAHKELHRLPHAQAGDQPDRLRLEGHDGKTRDEKPLDQSLSSGKGCCETLSRPPSQTQ